MANNGDEITADGEGHLRWVRNEVEQIMLFFRALLTTRDNADDLRHTLNNIVNQAVAARANELGEDPDAYYMPLGVDANRLIDEAVNIEIARLQHGDEWIPQRYVFQSFVQIPIGINPHNGDITFRSPRTGVQITIAKKNRNRTLKDLEAQGLVKFVSAEDSADGVPRVYYVENKEEIIFRHFRDVMTTYVTTEEADRAADHGQFYRQQYNVPEGGADGRRTVRSHLCDDADAPTQPLLIAAPAPDGPLALMPPPAVAVEGGGDDDGAAARGGRPLPPVDRDDMCPICLTPVEEILPANQLRCGECGKVTCADCVARQHNVSVDGNIKCACCRADNPF